MTATSAIPTDSQSVDAAPSPGPSAGDRLWLSRLTVADFRNLRAAELALEPAPVLLTGPNGSGKTNLLEAVSLLAPGRGLRRARLGDLERRGAGDNEGPGGMGAPGWAVAATVETPDGPHAIGTGKDPGAGSASGVREKRAVKLDGAFAASQQALGEIVRCVWLTPAMDRLFDEAPAGRRRFLDRLVYGFDPAHSGRIAAYENALRERARLLKAQAQGHMTGGGGADPAWLSALEATMAEKAVAIAAARRDTVARLAAALHEADGPEAAGPFPAAELGLAGDAEAWLGDLAAVEVEQRLAERLAADRAQDAETGGARVGAHRTDLTVAHGATGMPAALCSTGEQKALLVAVVLAHARLVRLDAGAGPLLLLDEVAAHLDAARRDALIDRVLALGLQAWVTGTDAEPFRRLAAHAQRVALDGGLVRQEGG